MVEQRHGGKEKEKEWKGSGGDEVGPLSITERGLLRTVRLPTGSWAARDRPQSFHKVLTAAQVAEIGKPYRYCKALYIYIFLYICNAAQPTLCINLMQKRVWLHHIVVQYLRVVLTAWQNATHARKANGSLSICAFYAGRVQT